MPLAPSTLHAHGTRGGIASTLRFGTRASSASAGLGPRRDHGRHRLHHVQRRAERAPRTP